MLDKPAYRPDEIEFLFPKEKSLLDEYFKVRDAVYLEQFNLPTAELLQDGYEAQPYTNFLVVRHNGKVIGGSRIIFHYEGSNTLLPFEGEDFKISDVFPDLNLPNVRYCEVDRTVLARDYRTGDLGREIVVHFVSKCKDEGAKYIFGIGPMIQVRNYKRHCTALGIDFHIQKDIILPDRRAYNGKKMWLTVTDLSYPTPSVSMLFQQTS